MTPILSLFLTASERFEFYQHRVRVCISVMIAIALTSLVFLRFEGEFLKQVLILVALFSLGIIFETDIRSHRIFLFPILLFTLVGSIFHALFHDKAPHSLLLGSIIAGIFFGMQYFFSRGRMLGLGDVWFGIAIGFFFGWSTLLFVLLIAYTGGASIAFFLLIRKRINRASVFPLGACLAVAAAITLFLPVPWALLGL